jgi:LacI family transcriptional regulator
VPVSMRDIARQAGVSVATVARALHGKKDVSPTTRTRVLQIARELNYQPNALAQGLVTARSRTIGLVVTDLLNPFFPELVKGIEEEAEHCGYSVILASSSYSPEKERKAIDLFTARRVDGLIISPCEVGDIQPTYAVLRQARIPFVLTKEVPDVMADVVMADDEQGAYDLVNHLLDCGRRRIAYIGSINAPAASDERLRGYNRALADRQVPHEPELVVECDHRDPSSVTQAFLRIWEGGKPDAVFAFSDLTAFICRQVMRRLNLHLPDKIALVGFDDVFLASYLDVPLTTVAIPKYRLGREAVRLLISRIEAAGDASPLQQPLYQRTILATRLVVRESAGEALMRERDQTSV